MSYYDEDYYSEPSEFDQKVEEFKEMLADSVKKEHADEMARLRNEVARLKGQTLNLRKLEQEASRAKADAEAAKRVAEHEGKREFAKMKFKELIEELGETKYCVGWKFKDSPKCDECEEDRYITFKTPQDVVMRARCICYKRTAVYEVQEQYVVEIQRNRDSSRKRDFNLWYEAKPGIRDDEDYVRSRWIKNARDLTDEEINKSLTEVGFDTKEEAQKWADKKNGESDES